jgi:hypothetical protein
MSISSNTCIQKTWGYHTGDYEKCYLLGRDAV